MNYRKSLIRIITMAVTFVGITMVASISHASTSPGKLLKMNIPTYRYSGYSYNAGLKSTSTTKEQHMWKIYEYNANGETIKNQNNGIYCLKMGVGFGSSGGSDTQQRLYEIYADMKNPIETDKEILNNYKENIIPSEENYNSIVWILDHCYIPAPTTIWPHTEA